jgi:hypothetical protein
VAPGHEISVRDMRARFGDPDAYGAVCSCGWRGEARTGTFPERQAGLDGSHHLDEVRPERGARIPAPAHLAELKAKLP